MENQEGLKKKISTKKRRDFNSYERGRLLLRKGRQTDSSQGRKGIGEWD